MPGTDTSSALDELRRARRKARAGNIDWVDAMYRAYLTGIVGVVAVIVLSGWVGDHDVSASGLADVRHHGAAAIGVAIALVVALGLRSGARGGPLAIEAADVRHVLLAPVDRRRALRDPALRQLRHTLFVGLVTGGIAGQLAARRLPGNPVGWTLAGAATAALAALAAIGAGYLAAGRGLRAAHASFLGAVLLGWSALDLSNVVPPSPTNLLGRLGLWPLHFDPLAFIAVAVAIALVVAGVAAIGGLVIEAAERRSTLIGRLAFAATLQDLRTVILLRRQLAQEHPRRVPWSRRVPGARRFPVWTRGWRGTLRWPLARVVRVVLLGIVAGVAALGVADGTTPLIVVAGLALYIAGLDAVESLAQEVDHPSRADAVPTPRGAILVRHLPSALVVMAAITAVGAAAAIVVRPQTTTAAVGAITAVSATFGSIAGAAISTVAGPPDVTSTWVLAPPEIAGVRMAARLLGPPALAVLGVAPVLGATRLSDTDALLSARLTPAAVLAIVSLIVDAGIFAWVYAREPVLEKISATFEQFGSSR